MGTNGLTGFERDVVDSVLVQLEGYWANRVTERATIRILRRTLRLIKPAVTVRSVDVAAAAMAGGRRDFAVDHAIPLATVVRELIKRRGISRDDLEQFLIARLVCVLITRREHDLLKQCGVRDCMPADWDLVAPFRAWLMGCHSPRRRKTPSISSASAREVHVTGGRRPVTSVTTRKITASTAKRYPI
jgi:hypothetical protein